MINRLRRSNTVPEGSGETTGFVVEDRYGVLTYNLGGSDNDLRRRVEGNQFVSKTANFSVTAKDHGKTFAFDDDAGSLVASLPDTTDVFPGFKVRFVVAKLAGAGDGHAISPVASDQIIGNGFTPADDTDVECSAGTDRLGDLIELEADGVLGWYVTRVIGTWALAT